MQNHYFQALFQKYFIDRVWNRSLEDLGWFNHRLVVALRIAHLVMRDLLDGMINLRAMGLVYTTLLALVPLLAVSFSVLKGFGVHNQLEPLLFNALSPLGEQGAIISQRIIGFVDNTKAGVLGSLGLVFLIYTVVSLLQKIEKAFNYTWRVTEHRSFAKRFSEYTSIVLIGPILLFSALGLSASLNNLHWVQEIMQLEAISTLYTFIARFIPYVLVIMAFTFIYILVPNTHVNPTSALIGGIFSGVVWDSTSWIFAAFVVNTAKYTAIYSAFASIIIFIFWIYMNWLILLVGCSVVSYHQQPELHNLQAKSFKPGSRFVENLGLSIMSLIGRHYHYKLECWSAPDLAQALNLSRAQIDAILDKLLSAGLLLKTQAEPGRYLPAYDIGEMSLLEIIRALRNSREFDQQFAPLLQEDVLKLGQDIEAAIAQPLGAKSLLEFVMSADAKPQDNA